MDWKHNPMLDSKELDLSGLHKGNGGEQKQFLWVNARYDIVAYRGQAVQLTGPKPWAQFHWAT